MNRVRRTTRYDQLLAYGISARAARQADARDFALSAMMMKGDLMRSADKF